MSNVRIIGIGSPFGNDTIGWRVIDGLKNRHIISTLQRERIDLITTDRPGMNLVQMLEGASFVILVDAIVDKRHHGELIKANVSHLLDAANPVSSHNLQIASALALANKLGSLPEKTILFGLGIDETAEVLVSEESITKLIDAITNELECYYAEPLLH